MHSTPSVVVLVTLCEKSFAILFKGSTPSSIRTPRRSKKNPHSVRPIHVSIKPDRKEYSPSVRVIDLLGWDLLPFFSLRLFSSSRLVLLLPSHSPLSHNNSAVVTLMQRYRIGTTYTLTQRVKNCSYLKCN